MRALALLLPVLLGSCAQVVVSQDEILKRSQAEIARREGWAGTAALMVAQQPGDYRMTWKVRAGEFDFSDYPVYRGIRFVPGTERELRFTADGCLIRYHHTQARCPTVHGGGAPVEMRRPTK